METGFFQALFSKCAQFTGRYRGLRKTNNHSQKQMQLHTQSPADPDGPAGLHLSKKLSL